MHTRKKMKPLYFLCLLLVVSKFSASKRVQMRNPPANRDSSSIKVSCKDKHKECNRYAELNYCNNVYRNWMVENCKKRCGFCPTTECKDTSPYGTTGCNYWKYQGHCRKNSETFEYMLYYCRKTCHCVGEKVTRTGKPSIVTAAKWTKPTTKATTAPPIKPTSSKAKCGLAKKPAIGVVVDGVNAPSDTWIWQAALYSFGEYFCGGSLISPRHVLTAAHCVYFKFETGMTVVLGDYDRQTKGGHEQEIEVEQVIYHEDYDGRNLDNDIAILILKNNVTLTDHIGVVCLPTSSENVAPGPTCYITGWGRMESYGNSADILQQAMLPIVTNEECAKRNKDNKGISLITNNMLCAGYKGDSKVSGCQGDSGGPLVCKSKDERWIQHGVVSWGSEDCTANERYTVFARTSRYISWIHSKL